MAAEELLGHPLILDCLNNDDVIEPITVVTDNGGPMRSIPVARWFAARPHFVHIRTRARSSGIAANLSAVGWFHARLAPPQEGVTESARAVLRNLERRGPAPVWSPAPVLSVGALAAMAAVPARQTTSRSTALVREAAGVAPRQLGRLTARDVSFGPGGAWVELALPAVPAARSHPGLPAGVVRLWASPSVLECPGEAMRVLVAETPTGPLMTEHALYRRVDSFGEAATVPLRLAARNRALVAVGYAGALRVEELSTARVEVLRCPAVNEAAGQEPKPAATAANATDTTDTNETSSSFEHALDHLRDEYDRLWARTKAEIAAGDTYEQDGPQPGGSSWGVSAVLRFDGDLLDNLVRHAHELQTITGPPHHARDPSALHTTIWMLEPYRANIAPGDDAVSRYVDLIAHATAGMAPIVIDYLGLNSSRSSAIAQGRPRTPTFWHLSDRLKDLAGLHRQPVHAGPRFAHTTLLDFHGPLTNGPAVARHIDDRRHDPIGTVTTTEISIVRYHWDDQNRIHMRPLETVTWRPPAA